jgi:hypothetical protein
MDFFRDSGSENESMSTATIISEEPESIEFTIASKYTNSRDALRKSRLAAVLLLTLMFFVYEC